MTCFALGAKWASPGRGGAAPAGVGAAPAAASAPAAPRPKREANAAQPTALAPWLRNWRRVSYRTYSWNGFMGRPRACTRSVRSPPASLVEDFIQVHQLVRQHGPRRQ